MGNYVLFMRWQVSIKHLQDYPERIFKDVPVAASYFEFGEA